MAKELQATGVAGSDQLLQEQASKEPRQYADRQEEAGPARDPLLPSDEMPPPGTRMGTCGGCVSAEPQLCSTAVRPIRAPRGFGSAAIVISVPAAVLNRRP